MGDLRMQRKSGAGFQLFVQDEPYTKLVFLSARKDCAIKQ